MSTTVTYKGNTLATVSNNTKTLKTAGKYMEGDVTLTDTSSTIVVSETLDANGGIIKTITTTDEVNLQTKTITPTSSIQTVNPDTGYDGFSQVIVNAGGSGSPTLTTKTITANGTYNASSDNADGYSSVTVNVPTGSTINNQDKTVSPTTSQQTITADSGYTGLGAVTVNAMPTMTLPTSASSSATSGYTSKATIGRSTAAQYINIPTGYNSAGAYYVISAVANGSATGPSSLSGSSATITTGTNTITLTKTGVTTTPTVSAGYVSSATASTATVALTASVTVNPTPTASGATVTIPAGYYSSQTTKSVTSGSATAPSTISGTAASVSTGTNTLTLTKTVSVTPTVSAGYISSGTAGNSSVSLTASVTTQAATTWRASTSSQTIAAGTYLTGAQTIAAVSQTNLSATNIKAGTTISVSNGSSNIWSVAGTYTSDATAAASDILSGETAYVNGNKITGTLSLTTVYTGSSAPSSSTGSNGDIYIQS